MRRASFTLLSTAALLCAVPAWADEAAAPADAAPAAAAPAKAAPAAKDGPDSGFYVSADFGVAFPDQELLTYHSVPLNANPPAGTATLHNQTGLAFAGIVGYDFGMFRVEAEGSYLRSNMVSFGNSSVMPTTFAQIPAGFHANSTGSTSIYSFMANALADLPTIDNANVFIGGGVGIAHTDFNNLSEFSNTNQFASTFLNTGKSTFAWQLIAGVRQKITNNIDVTIRYKYFSTSAANNLVGSAGGAFSAAPWRASQVLGGISYNFR